MRRRSLLSRLYDLPSRRTRRDRPHTVPAGRFLRAGSLAAKSLPRKIFLYTSEFQTLNRLAPRREMVSWLKGAIRVVYLTYPFARTCGCRKTHAHGSASRFRPTWSRIRPNPISRPGSEAVRLHPEHAQEEALRRLLPQQ